MTKTIKYLITFSILATVFLVLVFCYVKLHVIENCLFTSDSSTTSISVSKKTHNMIDTVAVKTCHIEINEAKYKAWLTFKDQESDKYVYWLSVETSFSFNNQTIPINVDFGELSILKYICCEVM